MLRGLVLAGLVFGVVTGSAMEAMAQATPDFHGVRVAVSNRNLDGELTFRFHVYGCGKHSGDIAVPLNRGTNQLVAIEGCDTNPADRVHLVIEGFRNLGRDVQEFMTRATCLPTGPAGGPANLVLVLSGESLAAVRATCD